MTVRAGTARTRPMPTDSGSTKDRLDAMSGGGGGGDDGKERSIRQSLCSPSLGPGLKSKTLVALSEAIMA